MLESKKKSLLNLGNESGTISEAIWKSLADWKQMSWDFSTNISWQHIDSTRNNNNNNNAVTQKRARWFLRLSCRMPHAACPMLHAVRDSCLVIKVKFVNLQFSSKRRLLVDWTHLFSAQQRRVQLGWLWRWLWRLWLWLRVRLQLRLRHRLWIHSQTWLYSHWGARSIGFSKLISSNKH